MSEQAMVMHRPMKHYAHLDPAHSIIFENLSSRVNVLNLNDYLRFYYARIQIA